MSPEPSTLTAYVIRVSVDDLEDHYGPFTPEHYDQARDHRAALQLVLAPDVEIQVIYVYAPDVDDAIVNFGTALATDPPDLLTARMAAGPMFEVELWCPPN